MGKLIDKWYSLSKLQMIIFSGVAALVLIGIVVLCIFLNTGYFAKTMRLLRVEGYVTLIDESGMETTIFDSMRFSNGQTLTTGIDSLASIAFDDDKIVTLQENSRATFVKNRKSMELVLSQGGVFFEVNKPLRDDETFDIRTSTMICGIRGTSGYVYVDDEGNSVLVLTSGHAHVSGVNPVSGQTKEVDVNPGQRITVYVIGDTVEFELVNVTVDDLDTDHISHIYNDVNLCETVCAATGWNAEDMRNRYYNVVGSDITAPTVYATVETTDATSATTTRSTTATEETTTATTTTAATTQATTATTTQATETTAPGATPTPTPTPTPRPTATPTPTPVPASNPGGSSSGGSSSTPTNPTRPEPTSTSETTEATEETEPTEQTERTEPTNETTSQTEPAGTTASTQPGTAGGNDGDGT
ncbi:MAG: FecR family protein [Saccharofermentans sp.]|nr:FecR family protein [Saccharofermentans sp.]